MSECTHAYTHACLCMPLCILAVFLPFFLFACGLCVMRAEAPTAESCRQRAFASEKQRSACAHPCCSFSCHHCHCWRAQGRAGCRLLRRHGDLAAVHGCGCTGQPLRSLLPHLVTGRGHPQQDLAGACAFACASMTSESSHAAGLSLVCDCRCCCCC